MFALMGLAFAWWWASLTLPTSFFALAVFGAAFGLGYGGFVGLAPPLVMGYFGARNLSGLIGLLYVAAGLNKPNQPAEPAEDVKGGIYVFTPEGKMLAFLAVPTDEVTNCAFGGDDLKTLYITGGGTLYSIPTTTAGRVVWPK